MATNTRARRSVSAASYTEVEAAPVKHALGELRILLIGEEDCEMDQDNIKSCLQQIQASRDALRDIERPNGIQDAFRNFNGFRAVLDLVRYCSKLLERESTRKLSIALLLPTIALLRDILHDHCGNRKYFSKRVDAGGWKTLHQELEIYLSKSSDDKGSMVKIFGELLACSVENEALVELLENLKAVEDTQDTAENLVKIVGSTIPTRTQIHNPEIFPILLCLWSKYAQSELPSLPLVLRVIYTKSTHNLLAVHEIGTLTTVLELLNRSGIPKAQQQELQVGAIELLQLGISHLKDAQLLYGKASASVQIANVLDEALQSSDGVSFIDFDMSLYGFSCIELPDLGKTFPPPTNVSAGYTLSIWFQIISFDPESHTTIFGAFDPSQTCFVLVYLEKDSKNLILQTSITASRPSVRFKSHEFKVGKWYHMCVVHKRPTMASSSSRASLFIDGEFVEQVKAHFPSPPPMTNGSDSSTTRKPSAVQAFIGTPRDLGSTTDHGKPTSEWRLASACLFGEVIGDDLIAVYYELGPRYYGNYQDCLGSFQTYQASASLNLRNESLHAGKEEKSVIVTAIRSKAGNLMPESRILLNISPWSIIKDGDQSVTGHSQFTKTLSKDASKNFRHWTRGGRSSIAMNAAIPSINKALVNLSGTAFLVGNPAVVNIQALDDATWRLGGCISIGLSLVEAANNGQELKSALGVFFATIKGSWRNSEAMEKENGFNILGSILLTKLTKLNQLKSEVLFYNMDEHGQSKSILYEILLKVLIFAGYEPEAPENSVINNPLAYRVLVVDLDIWRSASLEVQRLYFEQFTIFSVGSKYHVFNAKRLSRMRITKKWLSALKGDVFHTTNLSYSLKALRSLLESSLTTDAHRSIAQYITYAVHKTKERPNQLRYSKSIAKATPALGTIMRRSSVNDESDRIVPPILSAGRVLSRSEVGAEVFEMYAELLCQQDTANINKFATTITNKWLLHLITDDDPRVVISSMKILARVLTMNGKPYVDKFKDNTGGFTIMQHRLKKWWFISELWMICFAILFDIDIASLNLQKNSDLYSMLSSFRLSDIRIVYPGIMPVITDMLQSGLKSVIQNQSNIESSTQNVVNSGHARSKSYGEKPTIRSRALSLQPLQSLAGITEDLTYNTEDVKVVQTMSRFLSELQVHSKVFNTYTATSTYVQELLFLLFPLVVSSDVLSAEAELNSSDAALTFDGNDVVIRPLSNTSKYGTPIVKTTFVDGAPSPESTKAMPLKRGSSYVLITSQEPQYLPSSARLEAIASPKKGNSVRLSISHNLVQEILELVVAIYTDWVLHRKDFNGLGIFLKVPPAFQEHQAYFQSFILRHTLSSLENNMKLNQNLLAEPRVLANLQKLCSHLEESIFEGWFIDGADVVIDFLGELLEHLQRGDIKQLKSVRLCSEVIASMRAIMVRLVLLRLSENDDSLNESQTVKFLQKFSYWQTVLFNPDTTQEEFLKLLCYLLYTKLIAQHDMVRELAADLWRTLLVQKPQETAGVLYRIMGGDDSKVAKGFQKILEVDNISFLIWIDEHRTELDAIFLGRLTGVWENFTASQNRSTESNYKTRIARRREKLRLWENEGLMRDDALRRHEISADHWEANIYAAEHIKRQRTMQDQQDSLAFNLASWRNMQRDLNRPCGLFYDGETSKSKLDMTEGPNRMRLRLLPDRSPHLQDYKPKRAVSKAKRTLQVNAALFSATSGLAPSPTLSNFKQAGKVAGNTNPENPASDIEPDDDFEIVEDPDLENFEDKNRKVLRSLQRGDTVEYVHNVSRIVGLEACEGLLIVGKHAFYLMDYYFQRSDGEIIDVWQAPSDERDTYMQMISGQSGETTPSISADNTHETRSWRWEDILSISKRRFLFRDVGIEVFFMDGESYLITVVTPKLRDEVYSSLMSKAQGISNGLSSTSPEDLWRVESLRSVEDSPQTLGAKFSNVFTQGTSNPATKKWLKGEISNFQYLMLVNTMAGRTFNDLTQYPVFPWVLADYTSEELDLTNPRSFRDFSKPMGAQTPERQAEFNERYLSFAEMGDEHAPPFHYGTHYSTSMIVTGYLIRLQPFVQSYLLLQGGAFDHPDRIFYSIEKAWTSASRENMSDVRELIPEFFCLPEMFINGNQYDFGKRQGNGGGIDNVILPRWARGDPNIFIAKHRAALESEYVSKHLHEWIDLIFGHKQRGEAALEATNVFHHLSYRGAKNLDNITDAKDREVTIKIIHNFGQTPHQVFHKAHPSKETVGISLKRLDNAAEVLSRLPLPLLGEFDDNSNFAYLLTCCRNERTYRQSDIFIPS